MKYCHKDVPRRTIHFETTSEVIKALVPTNFVLSKYGSEHLTFATEPLMNNTEKFTLFFQSTKEPFMAPAPRFTVEIKSIGGEIRTMRGLGTACIGFTGALIGSIPSWVGSVSNRDLILTLFGAFVLFFLGGFLIAKYTKS